MKALLAVILLSGCSLLPLTAKDKIADGVKQYCTRATYSERVILRGEVNALIVPNSMKVTCIGDPE